MSGKLTGPLFFCRKECGMVDEYAKYMRGHYDMSAEEAAKIVETIAMDKIKIFECIYKHLSDDEIKEYCKDVMALGMAVGVLMASKKSQ